MTARDDYPNAAVDANSGPEVFDGQREVEAMFDEIDKLRAVVEEVLVKFDPKSSMGICTLCRSRRHEPDCPWRMAKEALA